MEEVAEKFLDEEAHNPVPGIVASERARFHRLVRQCAANWLLHPKAGLRITKTKNVVMLHFEGPLGGKSVSVFAMRVGYDTKDYRFIGPNADRKKLGLLPLSLIALDRMRDLYEAFLPERSGTDTITAVLKSDRLPDLVPLVEETRRALDGGQETSPPITTFPITVKKKQVPLMTSPPHGSLAPFTRTPSSGSPVLPRTAATLNIPNPPPLRSHGSPFSAHGMHPQPSSARGPLPTPAKSHSSGVASASDSKRIPRVGALMLSTPSPKRTAEFYARIFQMKPTRKTEDGSYVEFDLGGVVLIFKEDLTREERAAYGFGAVEKNRGWGAIYRIRAADYDLLRRRAKNVKGAIVRDNADPKSLILRDPAGFLLEILP